MVPGPNDHLARWTLQEIGTLDEASFEADMPDVSSTACTITFWFQANDLTGLQVLANAGNRNVAQKGWSVFLRDSSLVLRANLDGHSSQERSVSLMDGDLWRHFAGIIDPTDGAIVGLLDGSTAGWLAGESVETIEPGSVMEDRWLVIGGYTDAAGGHFDHTFGRQGTGLVDDFRIYERALRSDEIASFLGRDGRRPAAGFECVRAGEVSPATLRFVAVDSPDDESNILFYYWEFGDGQFASGHDVAHRYTRNGAYRVRLRVVNDDHRQDTVEQVIQIQDGDRPLQITPVFVNGSEGYGCYRIPSIVRATNGDLIAFAEGRLEECSDATPVIRIVCKRSGDNGHTWGPLQIVARNLLGDQEFGCMNCSPVVDTVRDTGRIVVVFNKKEYSEWEIAEGKGINRTHCIFSDDHGRTWHDEKDITLAVHRPYNPSYLDVYPDAARPENEEAAWRKQVPLPGHAIQLLGPNGMQAIHGRLLFAGSYTIGDDSVFDALNYVFWSDDLGDSWRIGATVKVREDGSSAKGLNETMAVELENGEVMLNSRNYQNDQLVGRRAVAVGSFDQAGDLHFQPAYHDPALVDSGVQATLIRFTRSDEKQFGGRSRILFANPDHPRARVNMTVRLSYDEGQSWPIRKVIDPGPSAYSDLVIQADKKIGLLYEQGNQGGIAYTNFALDWLTRGGDSLSETVTIGGSEPPR